MESCYTLLLRALITFLLAALSLLAQVDRPYVILVSVDGFRFDYPERYQAKNLLQMGREGVPAQALIPSYRTNTFPNHYSIATGLYPEHHGIVDNNFYDPKRNETYVNRPEKSHDGTWYGGTPLWVLAEKQGVRAASEFYPMDEAEIQGTRPSYYGPYDEKLPDAQRVDVVLKWLRLPEGQRPHLILLYFSDTDDSGHNFGPVSKETAAAVSRVDEQLGRLREGIRASGLPVNLFVVADHGMLATGSPVSLGKAADFAGLRAVPAFGAQVMLYSPDKALVDRAYQQLHNKDTRYRVFRRAETPAYLHYRDNDRIGDIIVMAATSSEIGIEQPDRALVSNKGAHGYDPRRFPEMRGIFFAQGPQLKSGLKLAPFENVHIYPLIARILGLKITKPIDGRLSVLAGALQR